MELGLTLANFGRHLTREATVALAQAAEELGLASVWTSEHLVVPADLFDPFGQIFDSLTTLTDVAALGVPFAPPVESPLPVLVGGHARPALGRAPAPGTAASAPASPSASGWSSASATARSRAGERTS